MVKILINEFYGNKRESQKHYYAKQNNVLSVIAQKDDSLSLLALKNFFTSVFMPNGFPESVSDDYVEYQIWDSLQAFASSITNTLATHAVLKGVGVGDATASPLAATITWLLRDGTSMVGRILFAYIQSSKLDADCKKWRLFADLTNDCAICIDLLSPYFSSYFTLIQCISGLSKSLVGTAGSATRAALTQHQARRNNLADVSAKDGSQETLVNLSALICSLIIVPLISNNSNLVWILFTAFTLLHVYCNYRAVKSVSMETFNTSRLAIFMHHYLKTGHVLSVKEVNSKENVWFFANDQFDKCNETIAFGTSLETHVSDSDQLEALIELYKNSQYILTYNKPGKMRISISLKNHYDSSSLLESALNAMIIYYAQNNFKTNDWRLQEIINEFNRESHDIIELLKLSRKLTSDVFADISIKATQIGWDLTRILITPDKWRYDFDEKIFDTWTSSL